MKKGNVDVIKDSSSRIYEYYKKNKRMPSYAEVCEICKLKSKNTAFNLIKKLESLGYVGRDSSGKILPKKVQNENTGVTLLGLVEAGFPTPSEESLQ